MKSPDGPEKEFGPTVHVESATCTGCGACVTACPVDVLSLDQESGKAVVAHLDDCCACFLCKDDCPTGAIVVNHDSGNPRLISIYDQLGIELEDWPT